MWHPSNDASSNAAPCPCCAPPPHPHGPPAWQRDAAFAIPHAPATPAATPPGPHAASPPAVVRDPGSGRIPIAALLNNDDDNDATMVDDDDEDEDETGAAIHDHASPLPMSPLPMSPLVLGPPTSRSATWPQIGAVQHHGHTTRGFPALTATWPPPPATVAEAASASASPHTPTVPPSRLGRASPAIPARRAVSARSSSTSSPSPAAAPAAAAPVRPFYVFTRASYRLMVECVKRGEIPSAAAIRTADPEHALSLKRWKRLQGNLKVVPVRDWPTVVHQAHLERAPDGSVRHASLQKTLQQLTSAYQYRRSRSGLTSDDVRRILATCTCHARNPDEDDDEGSLDHSHHHHHHTPVSPTTSTSSASVDGEVESVDPDWRKRARSPSHDDDEIDDESSSLSPVSPLRLRAHGPPTPPSPLHGSGMLVHRARANVRRAVSVRGGVRPWTPPQVEG
ncbi:hypothetical protein GGF31_006564 [Allomyces arbusculus]|nr:hypothetical protein GGF31_006564 [Allomyces arbusculus]